VFVGSIPSLIAAVVNKLNVYLEDERAQKCASKTARRVTWFFLIFLFLSRLVATAYCDVCATVFSIFWANCTYTLRVRIGSVERSNFVVFFFAAVFVSIPKQSRDRRWNLRSLVFHCICCVNDRLIARFCFVSFFVRCFSRPVSWRFGRDSRAACLFLRARCVFVVNVIRFYYLLFIIYC
jgi:hypothetical protein